MILSLSVNLCNINDGMSLDTLVNDQLDPQQSSQQDELKLNSIDCCVTKCLDMFRKSVGQPVARHLLKKAIGHFLSFMQSRMRQIKLNNFDADQNAEICESFESRPRCCKLLVQMFNTVMRVLRHEIDYCMQFLQEEAVVFFYEITVRFLTFFYVL